MSKYTIVSADAHILEPTNIWETWLPKKYQDKAPQLVSDVDGGDAWLFAGTTTPDPIGLTSTPGMAFDEFKWTGVKYSDARPGCYDGAERLKDMAIDGVDAEILYAPQRTIAHFLGDADDDFVLAGIDAYNNFLFDEFCAPDRSRLIGVAQIPSIGIDSAVDGLRKAKARGFKAVVLSNWPSGGGSCTTADDPFWAAAQDEDMPVTIHINLVSRKARQAQRVATDRSGNSKLYGSSDEDKAAVKQATKAKAVGGLSGVFSVVPSHISQLIFTGVFERFPKLHVNMVEIGMGWIPHFLEQMDDRYWRNRSWGEIPISQPPSYYWHNNMSGTFISDPIGIAIRHAVGVDTMMWSTDYPHHGNDWPLSRRAIMAEMGQIDPAERAKIICGNAVRVFKLDED